jgi:hypothetical protein
MTDRFADEVVPRLQERGVFRSEYEAPTLREHLELSCSAERAICPI